MKTEEQVHRYRYIGREHTYVRFEKWGEKQRIEAGEEFDSSCDSKLFGTFFVNIDNEKPKEEIQVTTEPTLEELTTSYINKFWQAPDKRWSAKTILEKLK